MAMTISHMSHLDHGLSVQDLQELLKKYKDRTSFFIDNFKLVEGKALCLLVGPIMGDPPVAESEVHYKNRGTVGNRSTNSRMVAHPGRYVDNVTVIAGPREQGMSCDLYTCYGGPLAPREPDDQSIPTEELRQEAKAFWAVHALADVDAFNQLAMAQLT